MGVMGMFSEQELRAAWAASTIMVLLLGLVLWNWWIGLLMLLVWGALAGFLTWHLFGKGWVEKFKNRQKREVKR